MYLSLFFVLILFLYDRCTLSFISIIFHSVHTKYSFAMRLMVAGHYRKAPETSVLQ